MKTINTDIDGVVILEPTIIEDARGYFFESFSQKRFNKEVNETIFVQDNESASLYGVVRGLHFQKGEHSQAKLVRVVYGEVLDVAVDIRKSSPTFGKYVSVRLNDKNKRQFFIPHGFAHGFSVLSEKVIFQYKCDRYYCPESEGSIRWNDPDLNINWGIAPQNIILSEKDAISPFFKDNLRNLFD